jgi:hypothetical protein
VVSCSRGTAWFQNVRQTCGYLECRLYTGRDADVQTNFSRKFYIKSVIENSNVHRETIKGGYKFFGELVGHNND